MSEHLLYRAQVGASLEQMRCERVAEQMRVHPLGFESRFLGELPQDQEGARPGECSAARVQEQVGPVATVEVRSAESQVAADGLGGRPAERDDALLVALAEHADYASIDVDGRARESDRLRDAEACPVHELHEGAVAHRTRCRPVRGLDQTFRLGGGQRARQRTNPPRRRDVGCRVVMAEAE